MGAIKKRSVRRFNLQDDPASPGFLLFRDATRKEIAEYAARMDEIRAQSSGPTYTMAQKLDIAELQANWSKGLITGAENWTDESGDTPTGEAMSDAFDELPPGVQKAFIERVIVVNLSSDVGLVQEVDRLGN